MKIKRKVIALLTAIAAACTFGIVPTTATAAVGTNANATDNVKQSLQYLKQLNALRAKQRKSLSSAQIAKAMTEDMGSYISPSMIASNTATGKPVPALKVNSDMMKWAQTRANELAAHAANNPYNPINHNNVDNGRPSWCDSYNLTKSKLYQGGTYFFGPEALAIGYPESNSAHNPINQWYSELTATSNLAVNRQGYGHYLTEVSPLADIAGFGVAKVAKGQWKGATIAVLEIANSSGSKGTTQTVEQALNNIDKDVTKPVLYGVGNVWIRVGGKFDPRAGVTATDNRDGDLTSKIKISGTVNTSVAGTYRVTYTVSDKAGNTATAIRTVTIKNGKAPKDVLAVRRGNLYYFKYSISGGAANRTIAYGKPSDTVLVGDWNGDGKDTLVVRRGNIYYFKDSIDGGAADRVIAYGKPDDTVLVGDWNGDGKDTLAVRRGNMYYFKDSITGGAADRVIAYGRPNDTVLVGDWNGDGKDTLGVRRSNIYYLKDSVYGGAADTVVGYGRPNDIVLVGDWDGDGRDTLTVRRGNVYYFKNVISGGSADAVIGYGKPNDVILVGAWK
ncbi:immunoglobulin-like domain-containing protein [Bifidobacterium leontopitheci]|uniref:Peptidase domain-containing protein (Listeria-bacteroides repeat domain) n=1 Tax=Bifidobacterium leontopitheci TaxID=2650774 RepID=A0A6I1GLY0_9BIFI|nr:immunoglobulin-like domain-containing protein [Bifidobacterium leontopitheci]KAB7790347.1 peptidase domain-containing protein (listeria-bacteroides repeat domain) [Bifidobacterium leontopitheci]